MKSAIQFGWVLLLGAASAAFAQPKPTLRPAAPKGLPKGEALKKGGPGGAPLNVPNGDVERLLAMPPEQRDRILEKLPPGKQANLRKRFEQFDKLPPEERAWRLELWKRF